MISLSLWATKATVSRAPASAQYFNQGRKIMRLNHFPHFSALIYAKELNTDTPPQGFFIKDTRTSDKWNWKTSFPLQQRGVTFRLSR